MPRRLAQQWMTSSDLEWPFHALRAISAVAELVCVSKGSFSALRSYARIASAVLGVVILSVRLSVTRVLCDKSEQCTADILIPHEIRLVFLHQQWLEDFWQGKRWHGTLV